jgi:DNA repair protein SbcC/Rad50
MINHEQALNKLDQLIAKKKERDQILANKDQQISSQTKKIQEVIELLETQKKKVEEKEKLLNVEKRTIGTQTDPFIDEKLDEESKKLAQEKHELDLKISELKKQAESDKLARDKELENLRKTVDNYAESIRTQGNNYKKVVAERNKFQTELFEKNQQIIDLNDQLTNAKKDDKEVVIYRDLLSRGYFAHNARKIQIDEPYSKEKLEKISKMGSI